MSQDSHIKDVPESSNPLVWTVGLLIPIVGLSLLFAMNYQKGTIIGREHGHMPASASSGPVEPDHLALIANYDSDVLDHGSVLFAKNCASCHGPEGHSNPTNLNPPPRNFRKDAFKNPNGGGPYGLFTVLTKGYNGMPGFPSLSPEDRYAVTHYFRETFVKPHNSDHYVDDSPEIKAKIPAAGAAGAGPSVKPSLRPVPTSSYALLAGTAVQAAPLAERAEAWIARAQDGAEGTTLEVVRSLNKQPAGYLNALEQAVAQQDKDAVQALLTNPTAGVSLPSAALLTSSEFDHLYAQLRKAKPNASVGVK